MPLTEPSKPYKNEEPFQTIRNIRGILERMGIFISEMLYPWADGFYSHGVFLSDEDLEGLQIGSFGKGTTMKYSLASAYGELIERLQNGVSFLRNYASLFHLKCAERRYLESGKVPASYKERLEKDNLVLNFIFGPDEKYLSCREAVEDYCYPSLRYILGEDSPDALITLLQDKLKRDELLCVPFYNTSRGEIEYVPIELVYRTSVSTGMCAGNTPEEAILHGICEVFERYAVKKIYTDELTPPTIPLEMFQGTRVFQYIETMQRFGNLNVIIKDCSMGMQLPVIGVLVIDTQNNRYTFNLGADPSPVTAVERCLSEMYQGGPNIHYYPLHISRDPFAETEGHNRSPQEIKRKNYFENLYQGIGAWPNSIFHDQPNYPFEGFPEDICRSDKEDLNIMVHKIRDLGFHLYIRDVSYLGFPSFFVYIPGMSAGKFALDTETLFGMEEIDRHLPTLWNLKGASEGEIKALGKAIDKNQAGVVPFAFDFRQHLLRSKTGGQLESLDPDIFLVVLYLRVNEYDTALKYMEKFLDRPVDARTPKNVQPFHYGLRDYLKLKSDNLPLERIFNTLAMLHGMQTAQQVLGQFSDPRGILESFLLPTCFNCDQCPIANDCKHFDVLAVVKRFHEKYENWTEDWLKKLQRIFSEAPV